MIETTRLFDYAQFAEASYVLWDQVGGFLDGSVQLALQNSDLKGGFSATQAADFVADWSVLSHMPDTASGFSATLFESKDNPGEIVLACRGTAGFDDLVLTDGGDILLDGIAIEQVVDLYNYWESLNIQGGYQAAKLITLEAETQALQDAYLVSAEAGAQLDAQYRAQGFIIDYGSGPLVRTIEFGASESLLAGTGLAVGSGAAIGKTLTVATGHSLGGQLAAAFARLFPELNVDVLAVNGAGFADNSNVDNLFTLLGGASAFDSSGLLNVYGSAGPQVAAQDWYLQQHGGYEEIFTESAGLEQSFGHDKEQMTDCLAVYDVFFRMDAALGSDLLGDALDTLRPLFEAAASDAERTLESLIGSLGRLFGVLTDDPKTGDRESLYAGLKAVQEAAGIDDDGNGFGLYRIESLIDKTANDLVLVATNPDPTNTSAIAYRYALKALNPFAVTGVDYQTLHNANGELDLYVSATVPGTSRSGTLTQQWIEDRAAFLAWKNLAYAQDRELVSGVDDVRFVDLGTGITIEVSTQAGEGGEVLPAADPRRFIFGGDDAEALTGGNYTADRLYGGFGTDVLNGRGGDDYLEGGAGLDVYQYSASESGINSNDGADTILDTDGRGVLRYHYNPGLLSADTDMVIADASVKLSDTQWQSADGRFTYTQEGADLRITMNDTAGGSLVLKDWQEGDFNIHLMEQRAPPQTTTEIFGDREYLDGDPAADGIQPTLDDLGNYVVTDTPKANRDDILYGDRPDTPVEPDAPGEHIVAGGGHDVILADLPSTKAINGLGNADWIEAGEGRDDVMAGPGDDYVEGGFDGRKDDQWGGDLIDAGEGDDTVFGDYQMTLAQAVSGSGFGTPSGLKGDFVSGGAGDDWLVGWSANDFLDGGEGSDLIIGGAGDDNLWGDGGYAAYAFDWSVDRLVTQQNGTIQYQTVFGAGIEDRDDSLGAADTIYGGDGSDWSFGGEGDDFIDAGEGDDLSFGEAGADTLVGGAGNDVLIGDNPGYVSGANEGGDYLDGGAGDDALQGDSGDDILLGGRGNDILIGGAGKDTYIFARGDGWDTVTDDSTGSEASALVFGEGFDRGNLTLRPGSMLLDFGNGDSVDLAGFDHNDPNAAVAFDSLVFADGTTLSFDDVLAMGFTVDGTEGNDDGHDADHPFLVGTAFIDHIYGNGGNDILAGLQGDDILVGGAGDDQLQGDDGNDMLHGGDGNDALFGQAGDDVLDGGAGFDYLAGDEGDDTYIFDAQDTVYDPSGNIVVQFGDEQTPEDIDLSMQVINGQTVRFLRLSPSAGGDPFSQGMGIELGDGIQTQTVSYAFADGTVLLEQEFFETSLTDQQILYGIAGDDTLAGYAGNDVFYGQDGNDQLIGRRGSDFLDGGEGNDTLAGDAGNDRLFGQHGNDTLDGGVGNDELVGGEGSDVYLFARGDGNDVIHDDGDSAAVDTLRFATGIASTDITLTHLDNGDLRIALTGSADTVTVSGYYNFPSSQIEQIEFDDGTVIDSATLNALQVAPIAGTEQDDVLSGTQYSDTLLGLGGNDVLDGGQGDDTLEGGTGLDGYALAFGGGRDTIIEEGSDSSEIRLGSQVRFSDLAALLEDGSDLRLSISGTADELIISNYALAPERWSVVDETGISKPLAQLLDELEQANGTVTAQTAETKYLSDTRAAFLSETHGGGLFQVQYQSSDAAVIYRNPPYGLDFNFQNPDGSTLTIEKITGGASDNIFDNSYSGPTVIDAGEGDDLVWAYGWGYSDTGEFVDGGAGDDRIFGTFNNDVLIGSSGNDHLAGGDGNDTYVVLAEDAGFKVIDEVVENISLAEGYGWNSMGARYSTDTIVFGPGIELEDLALSWGTFDSNTVDSSSQSRFYDTMNLSWDEDRGIRVVLADPGNVYVDLFRGESYGVEYFKFADGTVLTLGQLMDRLPLRPTIFGTEQGDTIFGTSDGDVIAGFGGDDSLIGLGGNDVFDGGAGDDNLDGGDGSDTYRFNQGSGVDTIYNYDTSPNRFDTLRFGPDIAPADVIVSEDEYGTVYLSILGGADRVKLWGFGSDAAWALNSIEFSDGTIWDSSEVLSRVTLAPGTDYRDFLAGGAEDDVITALGGDDDVFAGAGNDYVDGGPGDDYVEGNAGNDNLLGGEGADDLEDWEGISFFDGGAGDDYLYTDGGAAFVIGGTGNDYIDSRGAATIVAFNAGDGQDTVYAKNPIILSVGAGIDPANLSISQSDQDLVIDFGGGDSIELTRGWEQDPQAWPQIKLQLISDKVRTYDLSAVIGQFESLQAQDPSVTSWQFGSALQGYQLSESSDSAYGGDLAYDYAKFGSTDRLSINAIQASLADPNLGLAPQALTLPQNQAPTVAMPIADQIAEENAPFGFAVAEDAFSDLDAGDTLIYSAALADGSALPSWISFDPAARTFSGTPGNVDVGTLSVRVTATDSANGSASDVFEVTVVNTNDAPTLANAVADQSALEDTAFIFQIPIDSFADPDAGDALTYSASRADGSELPAWLIFDADTRSFSGTPSYANAGTVSVWVSASDGNGLSVSDIFELTVDLYPNLVLTGNEGDDTLIGHSGNDSLDGGLGADTMVGARGDDVFLVNDAGDLVIENAGEGTDLVQSSLTYTLSANVENLTLTGSAAINGTGDALDNRLVGNDADNVLRGGGGIDTLSGSAGHDILNGGAGADTLAGGLGDDNYIVDNAGDVVAENADEGSDTIRASIRWKLGANVENLILAGTAAINGQGNEEANLLIGNSVANTLAGATGNDILQGLGGNDVLIDASGAALFDGGAGGDSLTGSAGNEMFIGGMGNDTIATGAGADIIVFNLGDGQDTVAARIGADNTLSLGGGIAYGSLTFTKSGNDLVLNVGSADKVTFADWYSATANHSVVNLQVIAEAMAGFNPSGGDPLLDDKVETFDFAALANAFDAAGQVSGWALTNALLSAHLSGSDTEAIGGDLAYQYGKSGTLSGIGLTPAQDVLNASQFGSGVQTLRPIRDLQQGQIRLS